MAGKDGSPPSDNDLFRQAMEGTNRSHHRYHEKRHLPHESTPKTPLQLRKIQLSDPAPRSGVLIDEMDPGGILLFARDGVQKKSFRKLKRGELGFSATLDLHGCTTSRSEHELSQFLANSANDGYFTLLIIHGKGLHSDQHDSGKSGGILKQFTANWLRQQSRVLAFCSAIPRDGGTGALYVMLRTGAIQNSQ